MLCTKLIKLKFEVTYIIFAQVVAKMGTDKKNIKLDDKCMYTYR